MKTKIITLTIASIILITSLVGCNSATRKFGGDMTVDLPKGEKLVTTTWKEDSFWYLSRPMRTDEKPETYIFREKSQYGVLQGTVTVKESK